MKKYPSPGKAKALDLCNRIILFSLYGIAFFLPISKAIIESLSILAIVAFIIKKIIQLEDIPKTHLNSALFIYLGVCFFSILISTNFEISFRNFFGKVIQNVAFFFVVADTLNTEKRIKIFANILLLSSLLLCIDGVYQFFTHKEFIRNRASQDIPRIYATFPSANDFACYLYMVMPVAVVFFFLKYRKKLLKLAYLGLFILLFVCLVLTISRGGWLSFLGIALFMSIWLPQLSIVLLAIIALILFTNRFYFPVLKDRLNNFFSFFDTGGIDREKIWGAAIRMIMDRPWVGLGLGTFMFNFEKYIDNYIHTVPYAHNCYLQILSELGIIGLFSFLLILAIFLFNGIRILNTKSKTFFWYILLASQAAVVGFCIQMTVETNLYSLDLGMLFWLFLGLGDAVMRNVVLEQTAAKAQGY